MPAPAPTPGGRGASWFDQDATVPAGRACHLLGMCTARPNRVEPVPLVASASMLRPIPGPAYADAASSWSSTRPRAGRGPSSNWVRGSTALVQVQATWPSGRTSTAPPSGEAVASGQGAVSPPSSRPLRAPAAARARPPRRRPGDARQNRRSASACRRTDPATSGGGHRSTPRRAVRVARVHAVAVRPGRRDHGRGVALVEIGDPLVGGRGRLQAAAATGARSAHRPAVVRRGNCPAARRLPTRGPPRPASSPGCAPTGSRCSCPARPQASSGGRRHRPGSRCPRGRWPPPRRPW